MGQTRRSGKVLAAAVLAAATLGLWSPSSIAASRSLSPVRRSVGPLSPRLAALTRPSIERSSEGGQARAAGLPTSGPGSLLRHGGEILVRLRLRDLSSATRSSVVAVGATFIADGHDNSTATVAIPTTKLSALAALPALRWAQEELTPRLADREAVAQTARQALARTSPASVQAIQCPTGIVSEGDTQLKAAAARAASRVNGAGVKVGILSDSFDAQGGAAVDVINGELPGAANTCGFRTAVQVLADHSGTDEGRAMAQIVHDLAPGASLAFRTAFNGEQDFANGIRDLRNAGATVIVDDVSYDDEPMFQDGVVAAAIDDVEATGVTYFSSAANTNLIIGGQDVGSYEAPAFRAIDCPASVTANGEPKCHDFDPADPGASASDLLTVPGMGEVRVALGWSEPESGIQTDLDLYLLDAGTGGIAANTVVNNIQSGSASETLDFVNPSAGTKTYKLVIGRFTGGTPRIKVIFNRPSALTAVQWHTSVLGDIVGPTTYGHNAPLMGASVAATPFDNSDRIELFSSRGPALYCWKPVNGSTPAAALNPCQAKPIDFSATDGASNSFFGGPAAPFHFYGTSASAPHAAAVAALQRQAQPCRTPAQILAALRASGRPVGNFHQDAAGAGLIDATTAVTGLAPCPPGAPAAPAVLSATASSAAISWARPASLGSTVTSYRITRYAAHSSTADQTINTGNTATTRTMAGLTAGTLYRFRVAATNGTGTGVPSGYSAYAAPPFASLSAFTKQQFLDFDGRSPTSAELSAANAVLSSGAGGATPATQVAAATAFAYWGPNVDPVTRLYYAFFQRPPDSSGLNYWSVKRRSGEHLDVVANFFAASSEFQHTYGTLSNRQFVDLVYQNVLGRSGDSGGVTYWTAQLDQRKKNRGQVMIGFSESHEHKTRRAGEVNTVDVFYGMLRRVPTAAELTTWVPLSTTSKLFVITSILGTSAYDSRV